MAINEENGRNVFDPSKRIRGKLGNEFVQEAENNAFDKLKLVASASGMRSTSENNSDDTEENVKFNRVNIVHSSSEKPFTESSTLKVISRRMYNNFSDKKNFILGYKHADNKLPIINNMIGVIPGFITNDIVNNVISNKSLSTNQIVKFGACSIGQFGFESLTRLNRDSYNKNFEGLKLSKNDSKVINKVAFVESVKRAGLEVAKETVAPTAIRIALNKFMPEKVKNSLAYKLAVEDLNVTRIVTSTVGSICYNQYTKKVVEKGFKADATIYDMARSCAVTELNSRISVSNLGLESIGNVAVRVSDIVKGKKEEKVSEKPIESAIKFIDLTEISEIPEVKPVKKEETTKKETAKKPKTTKKAE